MTSSAILLIFISLLFCCILFDISVIPALLAGYLLFFFYGLGKGIKVKRLLSLSLSGILSIRSVLFTYTMIGCLTAIWRVSATTPLIVCAAVEFIYPSLFLVISFLLCAIMSTLTGTFLGALTTLGIICMTLGKSIGIDPILLGGAILSGCRAGDRCSPISTSALLISTVTDTSIYHNIKNMVRCCTVPFAASCLFYLFLGSGQTISVSCENIIALMKNNFTITPLAFIPVLLVIILPLFRVKIQYTIALSIIFAYAIALFTQGASHHQLLEVMVNGYHPANAELASILSGGGIASMVNILLILLITSTYSRLFEAIGILKETELLLTSLSRKITPYGTLLLTSIIMSIITCGQSLTIILTAQLCSSIYPSRSRLAAALEDTAAVIPALIPWSVCCAIPLATLDVSANSLLFACYIWMLPLWHFISQRFVEEENHS
ncbi:MAG: sodium:proton antiporter [Oscillospiraceae bacterium]|nr:sodium:proton antiporter [Oscillospiraceae bacterium]MBQ4538221.1 sodium:proton antiporter [Oscillospiraceae bacterium]